jgi:cytochrome c-type biogenesis protein
MFDSLAVSLSQMLTTHSLVVIVVAFLGGVVSSLSPCVVVMLPILIGYVGGYSEQSKLSVLRQILLFMVGFALVLTTLGVLAGFLGLMMSTMVGLWWYYVLGAIAILMGLQLMGWIQIPLPQFINKLPATESGRLLAPVILGAAFGAASSPCSTPFLTAILAFISKEQNWFLGGVSLFVYAFGQSMLLLVMGLFTGLLKQVALFRRVGSVMVKLSAIVFMLAGLRLIALAAGWFDPLAFYP